MRGKLEQSRAQIELVSIEVERIDREYRELWVSYEFTCPGGEYKSAMALTISNSRDMANLFFRELLDEARHLSEMESDESAGVTLFVMNKAETVLPIKNLCQRVIEVLSREVDLDESRPYIDLCTSGYHFKDPAASLSNKDFEARFKVFMSRARDKMDHGYYTIAADDLEKARFLCSVSPLIYKLIGICHRELGHLDLALEMFEHSRSLGDQDRDTFLYLAEVYFFLDDMPAAFKILSDMLERYHDDVRAMVEQANVMYQMDQDFTDVLDRSYALDPEATRLAIHQTFVFKKMGLTEQKRISIDQAANMLSIPASTILSLASRHRIPIRQYADLDEVVLDEHELKAWASVYRRYDLLQDEVEHISPPAREESDKGMALLS
jgi:tetratricopeptide (TPR) repeat protein